MKYKRTMATILLCIIVLVTTFTYYSYARPTMPLALFTYTETITVKNNGTLPITFGGVSTDMFHSFSWQKSMIVHVSRGYNFSYDKDGNPLLLIEGPSELAPKETYSVTITWNIESFQRVFPQIGIAESRRLGEIPSSLANYTREASPWKSPPDIRLDNDYWNNTEFFNLTLREVAFKLKGETESVLEILLNDVRWISNHIDYYSAEPTYPAETARNRKGDCDDQSNLLIALLRVQGIPSFLMMGQVYLLDEAYENVTETAMNGHFFYTASHTLGHAWAMVYVPPWGWLPCDPVTASYGYPYYAITEAAVRYPVTLVFRNVTGIYEMEGADYIGSSREETKRAEEEEVYFWLTSVMRQIPMPTYMIFLQSPVLILYAEIICFTALIVAVAIYDRRRAILPPNHLRGIYCIYCGARNHIDAIQCGHCGRRLRE